MDEEEKGENKRCTRRERQRWRSIKYKYFVTELMYIFEVSALDYFFLSFSSDNLLLCLPMLVHRYVYFLILTMKKHAFLCFNLVQ